MQAQNSPTPKAPRNARRNPKRAVTPKSQNELSRTQNAQSQFNLVTPPSSPSRSNSSGEAAADNSSNNNIEDTSRKKNARSGKKKNHPAQSSPMPNRAGGHRHTSSQPSVASPAANKDNAHYAGPTFHASPAPSALPMPTFFSKSVPDSGIAKSVESDQESPELDQANPTPSKPRAPPPTSGEREPSPLDFLFKAAREARAGNQVGTPEPKDRGYSPPHTDSKLHLRSQHEGTAGGMFALELEGSDQYNGRSIGPSFATPFKDRMNALRSSSSPVGPAIDADLANRDEHERKAKTEALKDLLLNPRPQRPAVGSPLVPDQSNIFRPRSATPSSTPGANRFVRHTSGPPTPVSYNGMQGPMKDDKSIPHQYLSSLANNPQQYRSPSSGLRKEFSPSGPMAREQPPTESPLVSRVSMSPSPYPIQPRNEMGSATPYYNKVSSPTPALNGYHGYPPKHHVPDTKQMEDDLRRILKLGVTSGISSNGV